MENKINKEVLSRYISGKFTRDDRQYIEQIFRDESYHSELQKYLKEDWFSICKNDVLEEHDLKHVLHELYYNIKHQQQHRRRRVIKTLWRTYSRIAAVLLFPLVLAYGIIFYQSEFARKQEMSHNISYAQIHAPLGSRISFTLPDGSTGWLNGGSSLEYPMIFGKSRDVVLSGEAYFNVVKDENKPFKVKIANMMISVLGTKFNVAAYNDDENVDVVLESGKVRLYDLELKKYIELKPDERVVYKKDKHKVLSKSKVNARKFSSWKEGKLVFRNDPIEEIAKRLSRWYNVDIEVRKKSTASDLRLRATFEDEDIEEVMRLLKLTLPIEYEIAARKKDREGKFEKRKIIIRVN